MPDNYKTTGPLYRILEKETRGKYTTQKFILEVPGYKEKMEYPCFELFGDKCDLLAQFRPGDPVEVVWELKGRENNGRWWTTLSAWKITHPGSDGQRKDPGRPFEGRPERPHPTAEYDQRRGRNTEDDINF